MRTCEVDGCDRKHVAKGYCKRHYNALATPDRHKPSEVQCVVCDAKVMRSTGGGRKFGHTCSNECRRRLAYGRSEELPADHWARWYGATCEWSPPKGDEPKPERARFQCGTCDDCDKVFIEPAGQTPSTYCGNRCASRASRRRRRAREHNSPGRFRYSEVMRLYRLAGKVCAYCQQPIIGLPDPEHVLPLSRGGRNDLSNLLAACRPCNTDKNDLTLDEWKADRERRHLPPVRTVLDATLPAFSHLWLREPTSPAWRDQQVA